MRIRDRQMQKRTGIGSRCETRLRIVRRYGMLGTSGVNDSNALEGQFHHLRG
jgi:hypothetical protein